MFFGARCWPCGVPSERGLNQKPIPTPDRFIAFVPQFFVLDVHPAFESAVGNARAPCERTARLLKRMRVDPLVRSGAKEGFDFIDVRLPAR